MTRSQYLTLTLLLGVITALPPFSVDTSLPAMPAIASDLGTDTGKVQLSIAAYIFGAAFGQLLTGALADRYGRKAVLNGVLIVFVLVSIGCTYASSIEMLIALRCLQGAATSAGRVLPRAMVRDLYDREDAAKLLAYMAVIGGVAPIVAPIIGGYLSETFGWRAVFVFITGYGALVLVLQWAFLRETLPEERRVPLHPVTTARNLWMVLHNRVFMSYVACLCALAGGLFAFLSASSTVLISYLGETPQDYGYDFAMVMVSNVVFSLLAARLVGRLGLDRLLGFGAALAALSGLVMAGLAWAGVDEVWAIIGPMFFYMVAYTLVVSTASAGGLSPFPALAGTAASYMGFIQVAFAAAVTAILGLLDDGTSIPMTTTIAVMGVLLLACYLLFVRTLPHRPDA